LGFLAKGPVALVLPMATVMFYLMWTRQLRRLFTLQVVAAGFCFAAVAIPWFALVGSETHGEYLRGFFLTHNRDRFLAAMEGHRGPFFYHLFSLLLGFLPWSTFLGPAAWYAFKESRAHAGSESEDTLDRRPEPAHQFLACWIAVYLVFFSISQTKLPNYILPLYPAVAIVVGRFLERWRTRAITPPSWVLACSLSGWTMLGAGTIFGILVASGAVEIGPPIRHHFAGLESCAWFGLVPLAASVVAGLCVWHRRLAAALVNLGLAAVLFAALLMAQGAPALDNHKAPRALVAAADAHRTDCDLQIGCYDWFEPSLVFYCQREVLYLNDEQKTLDFLQCPLPVYLFLPGTAWTNLAAKTNVPCRLLSRHWDFLKQCEVVVVTNR
jgi:4-amino-4-deoxy-L-arabinose transferase-like glycosyltransferase